MTLLELEHTLLGADIDVADPRAVRRVTVGVLGA
jgi:hypothetical protein